MRNAGKEVSNTIAEREFQTLFIPPGLKIITVKGGQTKTGRQHTAHSERKSPALSARNSASLLSAGSRQPV